VIIRWCWPRWLLRGRDPLRSVLVGRDWDVVIVDEAHRVRNPRSASGRLARERRSAVRSAPRRDRRQSGSGSQTVRGRAGVDRCPGRVGRRRMSGVHQLDPGLRFWLSYVEHGGGLIESVNGGALAWPRLELPAAEDLLGQARDTFTVDHGRIDLAAPLIRSYLPVIRAGAMIRYSVAGDEAFQERLGCWSDAETRRELPPALTAKRSCRLCRMRRTPPRCCPSISDRPSRPRIGCCQPGLTPGWRHWTARADLRAPPRSTAPGRTTGRCSTGSNADVPTRIPTGWRRSMPGPRRPVRSRPVGWPRSGRNTRPGG
jgi:hypothetical protein